MLPLLGMTCRSTAISCLSHPWPMMYWAHCENPSSGKPLPCLQQSTAFWKRLQNCPGYWECDLKCIHYHFWHHEGVAAWTRDNEDASPVSGNCSPGSCVAQWSYSLSLTALMKTGNKSSVTHLTEKSFPLWLWATKQLQKISSKFTIRGQFFFSLGTQIRTAMCFT